MEGADLFMDANAGAGPKATGCICTYGPISPARFPFLEPGQRHEVLLELTACFPSQVG